MTDGEWKEKLVELEKQFAELKQLARDHKSNTGDVTTTQAPTRAKDVTFDYLRYGNIWEWIRNTVKRLDDASQYPSFRYDLHRLLQRDAQGKLVWEGASERDIEFDRRTTRSVILHIHDLEMSERILSIYSEKELTFHELIKELDSGYDYNLQLTKHFVELKMAMMPTEKTVSSFIDWWSLNTRICFKPADCPKDVWDWFRWTLLRCRLDIMSPSTAMQLAHCKTNSEYLENARKFFRKDQDYNPHPPKNIRAKPARHRKR